MALPRRAQTILGALGMVLQARHRAQWAAGTLAGGPFAFPAAYGIVDFFFPASRNVFERQAGLGSGGYRHAGTGPVLGPAQLAALGTLAAITAVTLLGAPPPASSGEVTQPDRVIA